VEDAILQFLIGLIQISLNFLQTSTLTELVRKIQVVCHCAFCITPLNYTAFVSFCDTGVLKFTEF